MVGSPCHLFVIIVDAIDTFRVVDVFVVVIGVIDEVITIKIVLLAALMSVAVEVGLEVIIAMTFSI